jgi:hypothetical protein
MAINANFKRWDGTQWVDYKFLAHDSDRLGGVLPSGYALIGDVPSIAGSNGQIQFNNSGSLGASSNLF